MAIAFRDKANASVTGWTLTIAKPTGVVAGDFLLAIVTTLTEGRYTTPSGWEELVNVANDAALSAHPSVGIFWKVAGPAEPANYGFTFAGAAGNSEQCGSILAWSGAHASRPIAAASFEAAPMLSSTAHSAPFVRDPFFGQGSVVVRASVHGQNATATPPTGHTEREDFGYAGAGGITIAAFDKASDAETHGRAGIAFTAASVQNVGLSLVLREASASRDETPFLHGASTNASPGAVTDLDVALPKNAEVGDLLIAMHMIREGGLAADDTVTGPSGWTRLRDVVTSGQTLAQTVQSSLWARVVDGTEAPDGYLRWATSTQENHAVAVFHVSGTAGQLPEAWIETVAANAATSHVVSGARTRLAGSQILTLAHVDVGTTLVTPPGAPVEFLGTYGGGTAPAVGDARPSLGYWGSDTDAALVVALEEPAVGVSTNRTWGFSSTTGFIAYTLVLAPPSPVVRDHWGSVPLVAVAEPSAATRVGAVSALAQQGTSVQLSVPAEVQVGDLLIAFTTGRANEGSLPTDDGSWANLMATTPGTSGNLGAALMRVRWKFATSADVGSPSYVFSGQSTTSFVAGALAAYRHVDVRDLIHAIGTAGSGVASVNAPSLTFARAGIDLVFVAAEDTETQDFTLAGYTELADVESFIGGTGGTHLAVYEKAVGSGSTGTRAVSAGPSNATMRAVSVGLQKFAP